MVGLFSLFLSKILMPKKLFQNQFPRLSSGVPAAFIATGVAWLGALCLVILLGGSTASANPLMESNMQTSGGPSASTYRGHTIANDMVVVYNLSDMLKNGSAGNTTRGSSITQTLPITLPIIEESCRLDPTKNPADCPVVYELRKVHEVDERDLLQVGLYEIENSGTKGAMPNYDDIIMGIQATDGALCAEPAYMSSSGTHWASGGTHWASGGTHWASGGTHWASGGTHWASGGTHWASGASEDGSPVEVPQIEFNYQSQEAFKIIRRTLDNKWATEINVPMVMIDVFEPDLAQAGNLTVIDSAKIPLPELEGGPYFGIHGNLAYGMFRAVTPYADMNWGIQAFNEEGVALDAGIVEAVTEAINLLEPLLADESISPDAVSNRAIVNMSFGIDNDATNSCTRNALESLFAYGSNLGIVFIASAGNEGAATEYPAASEFVIDVAAVGSDWLSTRYSNEGRYDAPGGDNREALIIRHPTNMPIDDSSGGNAVDGDATSRGDSAGRDELGGGNFPVLNPQGESDEPQITGVVYYTATGTSFAAPIVSGIIAQMLAEDSTMDTMHALNNVSSVNCNIVGLPHVVQDRESPTCPSDTSNGPIVGGNQPPTVLTIAPLMCQLEQQCTTAIIATDADGDPLQYSIRGISDDFAIDASTGVITGTPTKSGQFSGWVKVGDPLNPSAYQPFEVDVNSPLSLRSPRDQSNEVRETVELRLLATDPDGDRITFRAVNLPPGLSLNRYTGLISGQPRAEGDYMVEVSASDKRGSLVKHTFQWIVGQSRILIGPPRAGNESRLLDNRGELYLPLIVR